MARLLIVDDEADVREFAANFFRRRNIECITASSGEEALSLLQKQKADLVLLDIRMNGIDGQETLMRIKEQDKDIKVIMVTGRKPEEEEISEKCRQAGASAYVHKPLEMDELERIVIEELRRAKKKA
ncbi:MAG: response regulator [Candidatus Omnitrophica bacterium]|nr:response regulator [Candidatus Omnitrophota bacterium]MBL7210412.1 response regulator [Candidatus Omnitrophota bacterium]